MEAALLCFTSQEGYNWGSHVLHGLAPIRMDQPESADARICTDQPESADAPIGTEEIQLDF